MLHRDSWARSRGEDFALWETTMEPTVIQIGNGLGTVVVCNRYASEGKTSQKSEFSRTKTSDVGGVDAPSSNGVRREYLRKCFCHGRSGARRFCRSRPGSVNVYGVKNAWGEIEEAVKSADFKPAELHQLIVKYAAGLIKLKPRLDLLLGRYYYETNRNHEHTSLDIYCRCDEIDGMVRDFFCRHRDYLSSVLELVQKITKGITCKGLVSAIIYLDQISRPMEGKEEMVAGIFLRIVVYLVSLVQSNFYSGLYRRAFHVEGELDLFEKLLRWFQDGVVSLSVLASSDAGFFGSPGCDAVLISDQVHENDWSVIQRLGQSLARRTSVSVNVTRMDSDAISLIRCLSAQRDVVCEKDVVKPTVCIYFDAWDLACVEILDFIIKDDAVGLHFVLNIPDVIMKRRVLGEEEFGIWGRNVSRRLSRLGNEEIFEKEYRRLENSNRHVTVCLPLFFEKLNTCLLLGNTGVVFCHHVVRYSIMDYNVPIPPCLGPDLASCNFTNYHIPVQRVVVNLSKCVHVCRQQSVSRKCYGEVFLGNNDQCFNFQILREVVRDAVLLANVRLDALCDKSDGKTQSAIEKFRSLSLGVVGLQTTLTMMGMTLHENLDFVERIFENLYYNALRTSVNLCIAGFSRFEWFQRTIYSKGKFVYQKYPECRLTISSQDWDSLRQDILKYGLRNAHFWALGPDDDVAQLLNVTPSVWPAANNVSDVRTVLHDVPADEFLRIPKLEKYCLRMPIVNRVMLKYSDEEVEKILVHDPILMEKKQFEPFLYSALKLEHHLYRMCSRGLCKFVDQCIALPIRRNYALSITAPLDRLTELYYFGMKVGVYKCCK
ncbi:ribonucleotide reductase subunit 1 [Saimiriine betaherpesvirus 4]|uniref:Ribonucleotide reductase subunit 1 n=1 Tax=Saimiriine betaherpesvirus 4 TaxID=1535247 RepID=G8XSV9_9BETA|nr:ribonucleotide reductase subunit 1 [Saimiriine betaherpesvirus 4]AEV80905.1 ribonucleotide reductase subunit 1 [Saimiriine betaherpesvirus 4]